jgi:hypothetical protein
VGGIETASSLKAKLLEVPAFLTRATTAELIAVSTPCEAENCRLASETLNDFFGGVDG